MSNETKSGLQALAFVILLTIILVMVFGCDQHIANVKTTEHLEKGEVVKRITECHLGHTAVATKSDLSGATFKTPSGWFFSLDEFWKDNDSMELEIDPKTYKVKVKTTE